MGASRTPLATLAGAWLVGLLCADAIPDGPWRGLTSVLAFAGALLSCVWGMLPGEPGAPRSTHGLLAVGALVCGLCAGPRSGPSRPTVPSGMARLEAVVEESSVGLDERGRAVIRVLQGARLEDGAEIEAGSFLSAGPTPLVRGAHVRLLAKLSARMPFRNPTPHPRSPPRYALTGQAFIADSHSVEVIDASWKSTLLDAARRRVRRALTTTLPTSAAGVARALVLGEGDAVDASEQDAVRGSGLLHVFAVSGLHVAILAGIFVALVRVALLRLPAIAAGYEARRFACALGVPAALLYADFAGGAPSAWRAAITAAIGWTLVALGRRPHAGAVSAMAALSLGALDPSEVTRPAFLLSIVATAAILMQPTEPANDLRSIVRDAAALSARTTLATAPIVLWCFGTVPIVGVLANLALLPFGSLLLVQSSAAHALLATLTPFSEPSGTLFTLLSDSFLTACGVFAGLAPSVTWPPPDVWQGLVMSIAAAWLLLASGLRTRLIITAAALCCLGLLELRLRHVEQPTDALRVTFLDVGQGDAALIDLPDGRLMLIDAGGNPGGGPDPGRAAILPLLQARRRARIDFAVLTHPHPDHYGGLAALIEQFPIGELWDSGQAAEEAELSTTSGETVKLLALARKHGTRIRDPHTLCGKPIMARGARIEVIAPCPFFDSGFDPNDNSLVLRIDYGKRSLLFVGDAELHEETALLQRGAKLHADVLKVGHHGSRTSTSEPFLHAVSPRLAVISAGAGNRFGHPHAEVLDRLKASVKHVLNLAETGGTIVSTDGRSIHTQSWSGKRLAL